MVTFTLTGSQTNGPTTDMTQANGVQKESQAHADQPNRNGFHANGTDSPLKTLVAQQAPRTPPPSRWAPKCHHLVEQVSQQVDDYFLAHWPFPNEKARKTYLKAGFSRVTSLYFPLAWDDRIQYACRLLTVLFLIDDLLEDMTLEEGRLYNEHLMPYMRGHLEPDRSNPAEYILYDLWEEMRAHDPILANEILEPTFVFMRSQTDKSRLEMKGLGNYLTYREGDVGKALLSALMRFTAGLRMSEQEVEALRPVEENCARHISVVNDIYSWEKEVRASQSGNAEGSVLCSAVKVLSDELKVGVEATKRVLWVAIREWEAVHDQLESALLQGGVPQRVKDYVKGLEYQMSGNEQWSKTTLRYHNLD